MPTTYRFKLHSDGPALWPSHKALHEVLELKATTPIGIWESTYQGNPTPPGGTVFLEAWWDQLETRYRADDQALKTLTVARWISWDTGFKDKAHSDYSAFVVGELLADYRMVIRRVRQERVTFPNLADWMAGTIKTFAADEKLRGVIIEDRGAGTSAYQTLAASSDPVLSRLLVPFNPSIGDKIQRAQQAAVWCKLGCILLPLPHNDVPWLYDFSEQLFRFPGDAHDDMVDSFSQLIIYCEHLLSAGWRLRQAQAGGRT